ncbi:MULTISPECIES: helix-turn-helix transcriptional regulator [unclassified Streptomyces]|uniref:helix-turn-helix transcriptional regulator n=1 Tax=unclassified Streptomyces TaxID=2593676 RepID=UPI002E2CCAA2|nr:AAA family ATPase [Streptomyces sp. NBC_00223]
MGVDREALLATARDALLSGTSVQLMGEPGAGRSTFLAELAAERSRDGWRVLRCAPAEADQLLPLCGLFDLLSGVEDEVFATLAPHERTLLRAALHRAPPTSQPGHAVLALRVAVLKTLTALCAHSPVLIAVDDAQWLDTPTSEALTFTTRRTSHLPLTTLTTYRTPPTAEASTADGQPPTAGSPHRETESRPTPRTDRQPPTAGSPHRGTEGGQRTVTGGAGGNTPRRQARPPRTDVHPETAEATLGGSRPRTDVHPATTPTPNGASRTRTDVHPPTSQATGRSHPVRTLTLPPPASAATPAEAAVESGDYALARTLAHALLRDPAARPADRVRAWLVVVDSCGQALAEIADVFPQALEDARDDPASLARLHLRMAWRAWIVEGSAPKAHTHATRSAVLAHRAADRRTELLALTQQAALEFYLGRTEAERTLVRALAAPQDPRVLFDHNGPVFLKHRRHLLHDRLDDARTELRALVHTVRHRGSAESLCQCLSGLAQVEIHRGRCERALELAHQSLRVTEQAGLSQGPAWYAVALAEAAGGSADRALTAAERATRHSEDDNDLLFLPRALHAEGHVRLLRGESAAALHALQRVRLLELGQGQGDPAMRRWQADLAEALVAAGRPAEAAELLAETRAQAVRLGRRGVLAVLERASALVTEERGDPEAAAHRLARAVERLTELPYRLEEGRTRLALGRVHARRGDHRAARTALAQAARLFTRIGARPWLALATAELDRLEVNAPVPAGTDLAALSTTERRVALLVAQGATNQETASTLTVSVKTVEAALTRAYRKLGVRSRVSLTRLILSRAPD